MGTVSDCFWIRSNLASSPPVKKARMKITKTAIRLFHLFKLNIRLLHFFAIIIWEEEKRYAILNKELIGESRGKCEKGYSTYDKI